MRKLAQNAKRITDYPGVKIGDEIAPNACKSLIGVIKNDYEVELYPHPATDNVTYLTTFYNAIRIAKDYVAQLQGLSEDPVKARTSYAYGMAMMKDPAQRSIIAYSKAWEYAQSDEGKAKIAAKQAKLQAEADAKLQREVERQDKLVAKQAKDEELLEKTRRRVAELEAKVASRKSEVSEIPATEDPAQHPSSDSSTEESVKESSPKPRTRSRNKKTGNNK